MDAIKRKLLAMSAWDFDQATLILTNRTFSGIFGTCSSTPMPSFTQMFPPCVANVNFAALHCAFSLSNSVEPSPRYTERFSPTHIDAYIFGESQPEKHFDDAGTEVGSEAYTRFRADRL